MIRPCADMFEDHARELLIRSLGIFHLGECGEGRIVQQVRDAHLPGIDDDYRHSVGLFVREEGRHARMLQLMVRALDGDLARSNWTSRVFTVVRRLFGVRFKLLVLLVAEIIGLAFYGSLRRGLPHGSLRSAIGEMVRDERFHLEFHVEFFRTQATTTWSRLAYRSCLWSVGAGAATIALVDHARTMNAVGVRTPAVAKRIAGLLLAADRLVLSEPLVRTTSNPSTTAC